MKARDIRNTIMLAHSHAGKTTIAEVLLYNGGATKKIGSVNDGTTVSDYNDDEKERKISISSSVMHINNAGKKINIIDTPGYADFVGEVIGGISAADSSLLIMSAVDGWQIGTDQGFKFIKKENLPCAVFINKMDKENADFNKCLKFAANKFGKKCVVVSYPIGSQNSFKGVANLLTKKDIDQIPAEEKSKVDDLIQALTEAVAESDDELLEKYLEKGELSTEEMSTAFKKGFSEGKIIPVMAGAATSNIGIKELLEVITNYFPSLSDRPPREATIVSKNEKAPIEPKEDAPFSAQVFKTLYDTYLGQISIFKVFSGKINSNSTFYNVSKGASEKIGQLFYLQGNQQVHTDFIIAGDIGGGAKLKNTQTGDSLGNEKNQIKFDDIIFPEPAISFSIKPKTRSDEDKISGTIQKLSSEDPTFKTTRDQQTRQLIASGMGDMHINIMVNRMKNRYGVQVDMGTPTVAYKETIMGKGDSHYRHKKQSGGAGQFAEVWLKVEPLPRGEGFEFVDEVVGGAIPGPFVVSCEKGIKSAMNSGMLAGFPAVDIRAIVYDGKTHPVDSKDIAFQIAAREAFKECCQKAKAVLLEPIMDVDIIAPDEYMGDITGTLNSRRGRIMGMEPSDGSQTIKAKVPLEEMYKYANELKSITGGRGTYTMKFSHYEVVPSNLAQAIIDKAKKVE